MCPDLVQTCSRAPGTAPQQRFVHINNGIMYLQVQVFLDI